MIEHGDHVIGIDESKMGSLSVRHRCELMSQGMLVLFPSEDDLNAQVKAVDGVLYTLPLAVLRRV